MVCLKVSDLVVQLIVVKLLELDLVGDGKNPESHFTALAIDRLQDKQVTGRKDVSGRDFEASSVLYSTSGRATARLSFTVRRLD